MFTEAAEHRIHSAYRTHICDMQVNVTLFYNLRFGCELV